MHGYWSRRNEFKYNLLGLFVMLIYTKGIEAKDKYFCSQWVAEVLDKSGIYHFEHVFFF